MDRNKLVGFRIRCFSNVFRRRFESMPSLKNAHEQVGISSFAVGYIVKNKDKPIYQKDLASALNITPGTASKVVSTLEQKGFIERKTDSGDSRLKTLVPTQKAIDMNSSIESDAANLENEVRRGFSDEELELFLSFIDRATDNLNNKE